VWGERGRSILLPADQLQVLDEVDACLWMEALATLNQLTRNAWTILQ
jgi:hypothetical protein